MNALKLRDADKEGIAMFRKLTLNMMNKVGDQLMLLTQIHNDVLLSKD